MVDVARLASVSQKTVSRVVNGEPHVSETVRARVNAAIAELGFRPNSAARVLASAKSHVIGLVYTGSALFGPNSMTVGVERAARAAGYSIAVVQTPDGTPASVASAFDDLLGRGVDGIVVSEPADNLQHTELLSRGVPVLFLEFQPENASDWIMVGINDRLAARTATEYLLALGHRTVWHIAGPAGWGTSQNRLLGWQDALTAAGAHIPEPLRGDWSTESGAAAGLKLAALASVSAVLAGNDEMAIGAIHSFEKAGLSVPRDISVVGMDDIPVAAYLHTPLTTMRQDFDQITREGMSRLLDAIEGRPVINRNLGLQAELVIRETAAEPSLNRP